MLALDRVCAAALWLPCAAVMMLICTGSRKGAMRGGLLLLCAYGLLGGMIQALWGASGSLPAAWCAGGAAALGMGVFVMRSGNKVCGTAAVKITVAYRGRKAEFDALLDSGNTLRDYLWRLPVIVLPMADVTEKLGLEDTAFRPIFAETAGGKTMMHCFTPQEIIVDFAGKKRRLKAAAALSPMMKAGLPALVPMTMLEDDQNG